MVKHSIAITSEVSLKRQKLPLNLVNLPEEILLRITSYLNQNDAYNLLLSNKTFNKPCKIRLYRKILICEKYQDTFFNNLSKYQHFTILSSWTNILKLFRLIYTNIKNQESLDLLEYIESIGSFNYLDCGKLDPHRYLLKSDLQNILEFRQYWEIVLNEFKNLKKFQFIKIPIEKLYCLNSDIRNNLTEVSINLDGFSGLKIKNLKLPSLLSLRLNLETKELSTSIIQAFVSILNSNGDGNNHILQRLEINGNFGKLDRDLEHSLRHHDWLNDVNLRSSFMKGYETAEMIHRFNNPLESLINSKTSKVEDVNESDEDDESDGDEVYDNVQLDDSDEEEEEFEELNPILKDVEFTIDKFNGFHNKDTDSQNFFELINSLATNGIVLHNLKRFTLNNITLNEDTQPLRDSLKLIIPNSSLLEEIHLKNVYCLHGSVSFLFNDSILESLNKLTFFSTPIPTDKETQLYELFHLQLILENSVNLKEIKYIATKDIKLMDFFLSLVEANNSKNWTKIVYIKPNEILSICRRLLNIKIFKRFKKFNNLKLIDDYYFGISKQLIEFFNSVTRFEDYGNDQDSNYYKNLVNDFLFVDEFRYLFKDDVKKFFVNLENLKEFVYFGFTFYRYEFSL